jgi:hypothetical protein
VERWLEVGAAALAALFWLISAAIGVFHAPEATLDTIRDDLIEIATWNTLGAFFSFLTLALHVAIKIGEARAARSHTRNPAGAFSSTPTGLPRKENNCSHPMHAPIGAPS